MARHPGIHSVGSDPMRMSKERLIQTIALAANLVTILGLLLVIMQLRQNRALMRAQVRHELAGTIVELLNSWATNNQFATVLRKGSLGESLTPDEQVQFRLRCNALLRYWEDVHYQHRLGLYDDEEYSKQEAAWKQSFETGIGLVNYWCEMRTLYSPRFASEIDGLLPPPGCEPAKESKSISPPH
jgi:hypothetical protein